VSKDRFRPGGLTRCCILTIEERKKPGTEGEVGQCTYCRFSMRFRDGAWEWADDIPVAGQAG